MRWESLVSAQNLKLAWRRINTARNLQYKRFFRQSYLVYESAVDDHLRELRRTLLAGVWQPSYATRLYLPKPSGLQRPLSLLAIEDQILLQAVANQFARKLRRRRARVELKNVFSNKLASQTDSIFFTERWQTTYRAFQEECTDVYNEGFQWAADFDLAAYYDTISHELLLKIVAPRSTDPRALDAVKKWLQFWSADDLSAVTGHGIPQGPVASDFLAESFFLPIDLKMRSEDCRYVRYVDDIRLFGRTENSVRRAAIILEQECRHRGLIPQSAKFEVRELRSAEDAMGSLPSIPPTDRTAAFEPVMDHKEARRILEASIDGRPLKVTDKSRFRYVMYRAPADKRILDRALLLLPRHPEHIDAFSAYFANYSYRPRIARVVLSYLASDLPYSYVRGELWHLMSRLGGKQELQRALDIARKDARSRKDCISLSWGVMHFFLRCEQLGLCRLGRRLASENPISRSLLAPIFPDREFKAGGHAVTLLKGNLMEELAGARELQKRAVSIGALGLRQRDLSVDCRTALLSLGVIRRRHRRTSRDWVSESLVTMYACRDRSIWRDLLLTEYEHALQILIEAKARLPSAYSEWLALQDSFNDIAVRSLFRFLKKKGLGGFSKTTDKNGKLVKYGSLIAPNMPFDRSHPSIASRLRDLHNRRNRVPGSHPYDEKGGSQNRWLTRRERDAFKTSLRIAINDISSLVERHR